MFLSDVSIRRPVFATMLNVILIVFGIFAWPKLSVDLIPNIDFPAVTVTIVYPGADPESVEQKVLDPLEKAVNSIAGLKELHSSAYPNFGQIVLLFNLEMKSSDVAQDVRDKVFAALGNLPEDVETPIIQKLDIMGSPIVKIALAADKLEIGKLSALAKDVIKPSFERIHGVARVDLTGNREREVHILINREQLSSFGLTPSDVINSVKQQNLDLPSGKVQDEARYWTVRVKGALTTADEIARLPILNPRGVSVRISEVATVIDTIQEEETAALLDGKPTVLLAVYKQTDANTTSVADATLDTVAKLNKELPKGVSVKVVMDNSEFIKGSINSVKLDLIIGAILTTIVVLLFLRNLWATIICSVALPTAVIATFAFLNFQGFTLNMMTTLALSLSIGILIDDAIVVIENIFRHISMKKSGAQAASDATREIGLAVLATTLTICAVFVPVAFMEGIVGRFFYQFGLTVTFAVLISLFVAFTMTPMLSSKYLKGDELSKNGFIRAFQEKIEHFFKRLDHLYRGILGWCLDHRGITLTIGVLTFILSAVMLKFVPMSFFPKEDRGAIAVFYTLPEGTRLEITKEMSLSLASEIKNYPGVTSIISSIASGQEKKPNSATLDVLLVDRTKRSFSQSDLMDRMREELGPKWAVKGAELMVSEATHGPGMRSYTIQIIFRGSRWDELVTYTDQVVEYIKKDVKDAVDVTSSKPKSQKEFKIKIDPLRAADVGLSTAQIAMSIRQLFEGLKVGEIEDVGTRYDIRLRVSDKDRLGGQDLAGVTFTNTRGQQIVLGSIAEIEESTAPATIARYDAERQITVLANFKGKDLNGAIDKIQGYVGKTLPPTITQKLSGEADIMKDAIASIVRALLLAVILVFMVLCAQYERYVAPLVIMLALPLSFTGAFGSLLITGQSMTIYAMIGLILLMGIVTKNGILLIDFTLQKMREGKSVHDALMEAGPIRLRPILMTTLAAGFGMVPVAVGHGVGGEMRSAMGVCVIGGLLVSTLLTLVIVPCFFSAIEGLLEKVARRKLKNQTPTA